MGLETVIRHLNQCIQEVAMSLATEKPTPKIGDLLAFRANYGRKWVVYPVTGITPTGRIKCGPYTLNPDWTVRGNQGYHGPWNAVPVTEEIEREIKISWAMEYLKYNKEFPEDFLLEVFERFKGK